MNEKNSFIRKSVSFNKEDETDKAMLDYLEKKSFTKYIKTLILNDMNKNINSEISSIGVQHQVNQPAHSATTNDLLDALNHIADILQTKDIQVNRTHESSYEDKGVSHDIGFVPQHTEEEPSSNKTKFKNIDKFAAFEQHML